MYKTSQHATRPGAKKHRGARTDSGRSLVQDEQLALPRDRPCEREDLPLPDGQVAPAARDRRVERDAGRACARASVLLFALALEREEPGGAERVVEDCVVELGEGVEVLAKGAAKELGLGREGQCLVSVSGWWVRDFWGSTG